MPIVLSLLALGGLAIVPTLNYATVCLNSTRLVDESMDGVYAADAGIEEAIWCLEHSQSPPSQLSQSINQMSVSLQTVNKGVYTAYFGELVQADSHSGYLDVDGAMVWDEGAGAYKYTITVTRLGGASSIHISEAGARLPVGYTYVASSAAGFTENLSTEEPDQVLLDVSGAQMLNWVFGIPRPSVSTSQPVKTQTFYVTGTGELAGDYAWVIAAREDIGEVGELTGGLYLITATASKGGEITARITADILMINGSATVVAWQISSN